MFHWENGLKLTAADLAIDFRRRQPRAFISHAHSDHIAPHEYALCTPETSALYQLRLGPRPTLEMPYRTPIDWGGLRLTTYPAGHCLGSAMLLAEDEGNRCSTRAISNSAPRPPPRRPNCPTPTSWSSKAPTAIPIPPAASRRGPDRTLRAVRRDLADGAVPVVQAYILGKSQEVTRLLTAEGIPVLATPQDPRGQPGLRIVRRGLGSIRAVCRPREPGWALVVPPGTPLDEVKRQVRFAVTGWAMDPRAKHRLGVDHAIALSDHADYNELIEAVGGSRRGGSTAPTAPRVSSIGSAIWVSTPTCSASPRIGVCSRARVVRNVSNSRLGGTSPRNEGRATQVLPKNWDSPICQRVVRSA